MKRILFLLLISGTLLGVNAQKASLTKAYNFYFDKDFVKAKEAIDLCIADEKLSTKAQTWLYKGNIYYYLANNEYSAKQKDSQYQILYPDAPTEAYDAFVKSREINPNAEAMDMFTAKEALRQLYPLLLVRGVDQLIAKDYNGAKATLEKGIASYEMDKPQYPMNGDLYYYYAYTLEAMGSTADLKNYFQKAIDDGSTIPYVYIRLIETYKKNDDPVKAKAILDGAKSKLPNDLSVKMAEIDYYFWTNDSVKAKSMLNTISPNSLKSEDEMVNLANFYIKEKRYEDAISLLEKANALNPNNYAVLYNLGVCTYSVSEKQFNKYNELAVKNTNSDEALAYKSKSEELLKESAEYFEKARVIEPQDLNLLKTLRAIYARQQSPKYDEIDAVIKQIEK